MKNNLNLYLSITFALGLSSDVFAAPLSITNTFQSGRPASAAEVNRNFSDIKTAVDDNDTRITSNTSSIQENSTAIAELNNMARLFAVYRDGNWIGQAMGDVGFDPDISIMSPAGYRFRLNPDGTLAALNNLFYVTSDCSGVAYVQYMQTAFVGWVFLAGDGNTYMTTKRNTASMVADVSSNSYLDTSGVCVVSSSLLSLAYESPSLNNELVTGIQDGGWIGSVITVGQ